MHPRQNIPKFDSKKKLSQELLLEDDEKFLFMVKKHSFGIIILYFGMLIALLVLTIVVALAGGNIGNVSEQVSVITISVVSVAVVTILLVATYIYFESRFVITDKHIVQILQIGLFNRKTSQLSLFNVEDVTVEKKGIFATMFNFGVLTIETAGEQKNFIFTYCPDPNFYADAVLDARRSLIEQQNVKPNEPNSVLN